MDDLMRDQKLFVQGCDLKNITSQFSPNDTRRNLKTEHRIVLSNL